MNRVQFNNNSIVSGFTDWAANYLVTLNVDLDVTGSGTGTAGGKRGPGVKLKCTSFDQIVNAYHWRSEWVHKNEHKHLSDDWVTTKKSLKDLGNWIKYEVNSGNNKEALAAAKEIVTWGGDRNPNRGAIPFLTSQKNLCGYLKKSKATFELATADTTKLANITNMNSMLTKVHALLADDGLPIYDSRVAGAIASIVEIYRQSLSSPWSKIPNTLLFKAPDRGECRRRVVALRGSHNNKVPQPGLDPGTFNLSNKASKINDWASAKVRLGWLLEAILDKADKNNNPIIKANTPLNGSMPNKMHAFEAGLFMIGFDIQCL